MEPNIAVRVFLHKREFTMRGETMSSDAGSQKTMDEKTKGANGHKSVAEQIELLKNDLSGLAQEVTGLTKEKIGGAVADVQNVAAEKVDDMTESIRRQPMQATAIAIGIGFVFGLLLSR